MIRWSGQSWYEQAPRPSGSACLTLLAMSEREMAEAKRRPIGFAPPRDSPKPHIRLKTSRRADA